MHNESLYRFGAAVIVMLIMAGWETVAPKRNLTTSKTGRWTINLSIIGLDNLMVMVLIPFTVIHISLAAEAGNWGLFNQLDLPTVPTIILSVLALDLIIYLQHLMFHAVPLFLVPTVLNRQKDTYT